jgi:hypothetical protein
MENYYLMYPLDGFMQVRSVLLAIILCLGLALPTYAATIFTEDYEVATVQDLGRKGWEVVLDANTTDIVSSPVHSGTKALRQTYAGIHTNDNFNSRIVKTFASASEIYARYYVRTEPIPPATQSGYTATTAKQHYLKVGGTSSDGMPDFVLTHWWGSREIAFASQGDALLGSHNDYPNLANVPMHDGRWYCVEYHIKMNTPNVAIRTNARKHFISIPFQKKLASQLHRQEPFLPGRQEDISSICRLYLLRLGDTIGSRHQSGGDVGLSLAPNLL